MHFVCLTKHDVRVAQRPRCASTEGTTSRQPQFGGVETPRFRSTHSLHAARSAKHSRLQLGVSHDYEPLAISRVMSPVWCRECHVASRRVPARGSERSTCGPPEEDDTNSNTLGAVGRGRCLQVRGNAHCRLHSACHDAEAHQRTCR